MQSFVQSLNYWRVQVRLKIKPVHPRAVIPAFATEGAACFDLVNIDSGQMIPAGSSAIFRTGLSFEMPDGYVMMIYSRSGMGFKNGIVLVNGTGVIDSDYRGEVQVGLRNNGPVAVQINTGDRIAQAMIVSLPLVEIDVVATLNESERGTGGFGSTGK
jgi:dUTP pyrophosphatase